MKILIFDDDFNVVGNKPAHIQKKSRRQTEIHTNIYGIKKETRFSSITAAFITVANLKRV